MSSTAAPSPARTVTAETWCAGCSRYTHPARPLSGHGHQCPARTDLPATIVARPRPADPGYVPAAIAALIRDVEAMGGTVRQDIGHRTLWEFTAYRVFVAANTARSIAGTVAGTAGFYVRDDGKACPRGMRATREFLHTIRRQITPGPARPL